MKAVHQQPKIPLKSRTWLVPPDFQHLCGICAHFLSFPGTPIMQMLVCLMLSAGPLECTHFFKLFFLFAVQLGRCPYPVFQIADA